MADTVGEISYNVNFVLDSMASAQAKIDEFIEQMTKGAVIPIQFQTDSGAAAGAGAATRRGAADQAMSDVAAAAWTRDPKYDFAADVIRSSHADSVTYQRNLQALANTYGTTPEEMESRLYGPPSTSSPASWMPSSGWSAAMNARQAAFKNQRSMAADENALAYEDAFGGHGGISEGLRRQISSEIPLTSQELADEQFASMGGSPKPPGAAKKGRFLNWHSYFMASIGTHMAAGAMNAIAGAIDNARAGARDEQMGGVSGDMARVKQVQADYKLVGQIPLAGQLGSAMRNLFEAIRGTDAASVTAQLTQSLKDTASQVALLSSRYKNQAAYAAEASKYENAIGNHAAAGAFAMQALSSKYRQQLDAANELYAKQIQQSTDDQQRLNYANELNTTMGSLVSIYRMQVVVAQESLANAKVARDNSWKILSQEYKASVSGHPMSTEEVLKAQIARETREYNAGKTLHIPEQGIPGRNDASLLARAKKLASQSDQASEAAAMWHDPGAKWAVHDRLEAVRLGAQSSTLMAQWAHEMRGTIVPAHSMHIPFSPHGKLHEEIMRQTIQLNALEQHTARKNGIAGRGQGAGWTPHDENYAPEINAMHRQSDAAAAAKHAKRLAQLTAAAHRRELMLTHSVLRDNTDRERQEGMKIDPLGGAAQVDPFSYATHGYAGVSSKAQQDEAKIKLIETAITKGCAAIVKALGAPAFGS